jgi:hypothetical protein
MRSETHDFYALSDLQTFLTALSEAKKSFRTARNGRPKPGKWLYRVVVYDAA